jgi:hypothetical protein
VRGDRIGHLATDRRSEGVVRRVRDRDAASQEQTIPVLERDLELVVDRCARRLTRARGARFLVVLLPRRSPDDQLTLSRPTATTEHT